MVDPTNAPDIEEYSGNFSRKGLIQAILHPVPRYTVWYLSDQGTVTVDDLAGEITGLVAADDASMATPKDRQRVEIVLYHIHLPKLDELGIVRFDAEDMAVELLAQSEATEAFASLLNSLDHGAMEERLE